MAAIHAVHSGTYNYGGRNEKGRVPVRVSHFHISGQVDGDSGPGESGTRFGVLDEGQVSHKRTNLVQNDPRRIRNGPHRPVAGILLLGNSNNSNNNIIYIYTLYIIVFYN